MQRLTLIVIEKRWSNPPSHQNNKYTTSVPILFNNLREDFKFKHPTTMASKQLGSSRLTTERKQHATGPQQE